MRRAFAAVLGLAAALVVVPAQPASAHAIGGITATNYRSDITAITPPVPGLTVRLVELARRMEVSNRTGQDVVVLGYQNEPYLRVGPSGVFENKRSPTLYQNKANNTDTALVTLPPEADPAAPPDWVHKGGGTTVSWRDHRIRWTGADPPGVVANPGQAQVVVSRWTVPLLHGDQSVAVTGRISWIPGPAAVPWFLLAVVFFAGVFAGGATRWWPGVLSSALAVLVAVDAVRLWGAATSTGGSAAGALIQALLFGILEAAALAAGAWAIGQIQRGKPVGAYTAMAVGTVIGFVSGFGDLLNLAYSQVPTSIPVDYARFAVAVCLGIGFGLIGGGIMALRRLGVTAAMPLATGRP